MYQNKTKLFLLVLLSLALAGCGGVFKATDGSSVTYNSIHKELDRAGVGNDAFDGVTPTPGGSVDIPGAPSHDLPLGVKVKRRCEVGEIDLIALAMTCKPNLPLILTLKDDAGEKVLKNFGSLQTGNSVEGILSALKSFQVESNFIGSDADIFLCLDSNKNGQCTDEWITDLNEFNAEMIFGNREADGRQQACATDNIRGLEKGLVLFHRHYKLPMHDVMASHNENVAGQVGDYLRNLADEDGREHFDQLNGVDQEELRQMLEGGTPSSSKEIVVVLAESNKNQCARKSPRKAGCFVKGTEISLSKEISLPIEKVLVGDQVLLANGKRSKILEIIKGPEAKPVIKISLRNGKELTVTDTHPMLTKEGLVQANELQLDTQLKMRTGQWVEISALDRISYNDEVINFTLAGENDHDHLVIANGVVSGDLYLQQKLQIKDVKNNLASQETTHRFLKDLSKPITH